MIDCATCICRRDIYCKHPFAAKYMLCGYGKTPENCPIKNETPEAKKIYLQK